MKHFIKQLVKMATQGILLPVIYRVAKNKQVDDNLVLIADAHKDYIPLNLEDIYDYAINNNYDVKVICFDSSKNGFFENFSKYVSFMKLYANARYVFISDNFLPVASCRKRPETCVVQLWHAGGILKKFGYDTKRDIPGYYLFNVFKNYSLVTTSAPICDAAYVSGMRLDEKVVHSLGCVRTDRLFDDDYTSRCKKDFFEKYPDYKNKKILLYAPTFRGNGADPKANSIDFLEKLQTDIGDEWSIICKLHPHLSDIENKYDVDFDTSKLLPVADLLISDYSSVIFDFCIMLKPMVFYVPDLDEFIEKSELYIDYNEMPGPIVTGYEDLLRAVISSRNSSYLEKMEDFKDKYMASCDGQVLKKIIAFIEMK